MSPKSCVHSEAGPLKGDMGAVAEGGVRRWDPVRKVVPGA